MPEEIDGFTIVRGWVEANEGTYYPAIDVEKREGDKRLHNSKTIRSLGSFSRIENAAAAAKCIEVRGVALNALGVPVIIVTDPSF